MVSRIVQTLLLLAVVTSPLLAQNTQRLWYRGPFDGWVELRDNPAYGYYYSPSPNPAYPLNEQAYGRPVPCAKCGHAHFPGKNICPVCHQQCPAGGNDLDDRTVYTPRRLPGYYYYEEQPHYTWSSPLRLGGSYKKYDHRWD